MLILKISCLVVLIKCAYSEDPLLVTTSMGQIKGHYRTTKTNTTTYKAFTGIPFAQPPIGSNRFLPPKPVKPWKDVLMAENFTKCIGHGASPEYQSVETEDCLYLNVYVPEKITCNQSLPVIVFIYGGGFQFEGLKTLDSMADHFIDKNVIFATFNYRHGILGFLSTEDDVVSGNMGLKDQSLALRWLKDHINSFGGDSDRITIVGVSAGAVSVHYHYLSPMSAGLFRTGMSLSGTALMPWALTKNSRNKALKLGELMNCDTTDIREMIECLRSVPARNLFEAQNNFTAWRGSEFAPFGPVVEKNTNNAFIDRPPIDIICSGKAQNLTWITGVVSEEGLLPIAEFFLNETVMKELDRNWKSIAPELLQYYYTVPAIEQPKIADKVRNYYLGDKAFDKNDKEFLRNLTHLVGDRNFGFGSVMAAKLQAEANRASVYYYYYSYRAAESPISESSGSKENFGTAHGDDEQLIVRELGDSEKEKEDAKVQKRLIDLWVSVAHNGKPDSELEWQRLSDQSEDFEYLEISGPDAWTMKKNNNLVNHQFWDSIDFNELRETNVV